MRTHLGTVGKTDRELVRIRVVVGRDEREPRCLRAAQALAVASDHEEAAVAGHAVGIETHFVGMTKAEALDGRDRDPRD